MPRPRDISGKYLPSRERIGRMEMSELVETLRRFGVSVDTSRLDEVGRRALEQLAAAPNPSPRLIEQAAKRLISGYRRELTRVAKDYVRVAERRVWGLEGRAARDAMAMWLAVYDEDTCPDCIDNHGEERTMREWAAAGLPGSSNLICNGACRCELLPADDLAELEREGGDISVGVELVIERD